VIGLGGVANWAEEDSTCGNTCQLSPVSGRFGGTLEGIWRGKGASGGILKQVRKEGGTVLKPSGGTTSLEVEDGTESEKCVNREGKSNGVSPRAATSLTHPQKEEKAL